MSCALAGYLEVSLVSYAAVRPVHVADLLSREGHPLASRVTAARDARVQEPEKLDAVPARRTLGVAAGAMMVLGTVVAGALGLNHHTPTAAPAAGGEPVGALPGKGSPGAPNQGPAAQAVTPQFTNTAATSDGLTQPAGAPAGQIGVPARVPPPPVQAAPAPRPVQPAAPKLAAPAAPAPAPAAPAPSAPSAGPVRTLTEPVAQTVGGSTLGNAVAPVTQTVDNTLQPALSLIGGLLSPLGS